MIYCDRVWCTEIDSVNVCLVVIFCADVNNMGSFSINAWKSSLWWSRSFNVFDIAFLQMSIGLMVVGCGISSCGILVGDGSGGVENKSTIFLSTEGFVVFTFLSLACLFSSLTNCLNCSSTRIFIFGGLYQDFGHLSMEFILIV